MMDQERVFHNFYEMDRPGVSDAADSEALGTLYSHWSKLLVNRCPSLLSFFSSCIFADMSKMVSLDIIILIHKYDLDLELVDKEQMDQLLRRFVRIVEPRLESTSLSMTFSTYFQSVKIGVFRYFLV